MASGIINTIGNTVIGTNAESLSIPSGVFTEACYMTLGKGNWVITGGLKFDSNFSDTYACQLKVGTSYISGAFTRSVGTAGGGSNLSWINNITENNTRVSLMVIQSSGSDKDIVNVALKAIKIA